MRRSIVLGLVSALAGTSAAAAPERISIPLGDVKLRAVLYRPAGNGPFPAIVALHACDGLAARTMAIAPRYRAWGEHLAAAGFVVVFPDSFRSRALRPQCSLRGRTMATGRERTADAYAARRWLQAQNYVAPDRVSLLGWANGGVATLWAVRPRLAERDGKPDFRSSVALYPGCQRLREAAWSARLPTLILIGAKDDWTPAAACEQMVAGARGRSARTAMTIYPGAHHAFDHPNLPLQLRTGIAFSGDGSGRVHVGSDPAARADAMKRVTEWLAR
jgi:dienelactone hydrolase